MRISFVVFSIATAAFLMCSGCNPDVGMKKITGKITYQGKPVDFAGVNFFPDDPAGEPAAGRTDANGVYSITSATAQKGGSGAKPGKYKVLVTKKQELPPDPLEVELKENKITQEEYSKKVRERGSKGAPTAKMPSLIPEKYSSPSTTPLEFTVEDKSVNEFNIDLVD